MASGLLPDPSSTLADVQIPTPTLMIDKAATTRMTFTAMTHALHKDVKMDLINSSTRQMILSAVVAGRPEASSCRPTYTILGRQSRHQVRTMCRIVGVSLLNRLMGMQIGVRLVHPEFVKRESTLGNDPRSVRRGRK